MPAEAPPRTDQQCDVSVIIPALELTDNTIRIVRGLGSQRHDFSHEVVLVLNHEACVLPAAFPERVRVLFEPRPGSFAARNTGIRHAHGRILAFTDSDAIPQAHWLRAGYEAVERLGGNTLVAGHVQMFHNRRTPAAVFDGGFYLQQKRYVEDYGFGATVNLFVPARVLAGAEMFREDMHASGDVDFCRRARAAGHAISYEENAVVFHPTRDSLRELLRKERRHAGGAGAEPGRAPGSMLRNEIIMFCARARMIQDTQPLPGGLSVQFVGFLVMCVRIYERIRVRLGGEPGRL